MNEILEEKESSKRKEENERDSIRNTENMLQEILSKFVKNKPAQNEATQTEQPALQDNSTQCLITEKKSQLAQTENCSISNKQCNESSFMEKICGNIKYLSTQTFWFVRVESSLKIK